MEGTLFGSDGLSRRSFLSRSGSVGSGRHGGRAAVRLLVGKRRGKRAADAPGGESPAAANASGIGVVVDPATTEDADIVVVGSGIGGFMASMIAKEQAPDAVVVMLEKNAVLGGSTNYAECNGPASNTPEDEARLKGMQSASRTSYIANSMLHTERLREAGDNADWLFALHGVGYYNPGGPDFYEGGNGSSCIATLTPIAQEEGVDIRTESRATALLTDDEYTVTGVQYTDPDGNVVHVNAKAVILATGGMSTNKELLGQYSSQDMSKIIGWGEGQDGDGHLMAEQTAHGRANHLCVASLFNNVGNSEDSFAYDSKLGVCMAMQYSDCFVNEYGIRFADESNGGGLGTSESGKLIESQGYVFSILDSPRSTRTRPAAARATTPASPTPAWEPPSTCAPSSSSTPTRTTSGQAKPSRSWPTAVAADVPTFVVEDFLAEMDAYNKACEAGVDEVFGKDAQYLWPCNVGPFYAMRVCSGMLNTCGGIRIDRNAQVCDTHSKPVEGLFAAGVCTSGWDGEVYGGGTCQTVGMWAGSKAARYIVENILGGTVADELDGRRELLQDQAGGPGAGEGAPPENAGDGAEGAPAA